LGGAVNGDVKISSNSWMTQLTLNGKGSNPGIKFTYSNGLLGYLYAAQRELYWNNTDGVSSILHSSNYSEYALTLATAQDVTGIKNFVNGFNVGGNLISYDTSLKAFVLNGNLIVKGGIAWEKQNS
jgi:hypothetical protein